MFHQHPPRPKKACFKSGPVANAFVDEIEEIADATTSGLALSPEPPSYNELIEMRQLLLKNFEDQYEPMSPPPLLLLSKAYDGGAHESKAFDGGDDESNAYLDQAPKSNDESNAYLDHGDEIEEIAVIIPAKEKKKRVRKTKTATDATEPELLPQPKDNRGRFAAKRPIDAAAVPAAKRQKKDPDTKKYVAAGEFLLSKRYLLPEREQDAQVDLEPVAFDEFVVMEEASEDIEDYLRACVKLEVSGRHRDLQNIIDEGKAIDFYFKLNQAKKNDAGKKPSAVELYRQLSEILDMPGSEDMNSRWCQRRRALAKISEVLNLKRYGYRCSPTDLINVAPQIERANKLKLVNFE